MTTDDRQGLTEKYSDYGSKFGSPMACYVFDAILLNGDFGDDEVGQDDGPWFQRYGRRILVGSSSGFVDLSTFETVEEAVNAMEALHEEYDEREEFDAFDYDDDVRERMTCHACGNPRSSDLYGGLCTTCATSAAAQGIQYDSFTKEED